MLETFFLAALLATATPTPQLPHALPSTIVRAPKATLSLEVAADEADREHGLMDRTVLPAHTGMLFVFDSDDLQSFWMKDTLVPLDMVFIGADGVVRKVFAGVPVVAPDLPDGEIPLETARAKYVIELPSGEAARDGRAAGTKVPRVLAVATRP